MFYYFCFIILLVVLEPTKSVYSYVTLSVDKLVSMLDPTNSSRAEQVNILWLVSAALPPGLAGWL